MTCSSRISRIFPTALPLTLESIPADFRPFPSPSLAFANAVLIEDEHRGGTRSPGDVKKQWLSSSPMPEIPSILPPTSPMKILSWESGPFDSPPPITKHERYTHEASQERSKARRSALRQNSSQKRNDSSQSSGLTSPVKHHAQQDALNRINSSPAFTTSPDRTCRMMVATRVHRHHSRQDEQLLPENRDDTKSRRHRYSHVVRTDALAPSPAQRTACNSFQPSTNQRQPWPRDNHEIDWARYFSSQPLPTSATWSRLGATVYQVDGTWTGSVRLINP